LFFQETQEIVKKGALRVVFNPEFMIVAVARKELEEYQRFVE